MRKKLGRRPRKVLSKKGMTKKKAIKVLQEMSQLDLKEQRKEKNKIEKAFRVFLYSNPTEDEFSETMNKVILTARMLYMFMFGVKDSE